MQIGTELEPQKNQYVRYYGQQHTIPARDRAADDELVLVAIFEVEMYQ